MDFPFHQSEEDGWEQALIEILCSVTTDENSPPNEVFKIKKIKESYKKSKGILKQ